MADRVVHVEIGVSTGSLVLWTVVSISVAVASLLQFVRWVRIAQRENFEPGAVLTFFGRWAAPDSASATAVTHRNSISTRIISAPFSATGQMIDNRRKASNTYRAGAAERKTVKPISFPMVIVVVVALAIATNSDPIALVFAVVYALVFPWGMPLRSSSLPLKWNVRVVIVALVTLGIFAVVAALLIVWRHPLAIIAADLLLVPFAIEVAVRLTHPFDRRAAQRNANASADAIRERHVLVDVVTGSCDVDETSHLLRELRRGSDRVTFAKRPSTSLDEVARHVRDDVTEWTTTYVIPLECRRPDTWRELCDWLSPHVAIFTGVGQENLESFDTPDNIAAGLFALAQRSTTVVVNADDARLARWVDDLRSSGVVVVRAGTDATYDVSVARSGDSWHVRLAGEEVATVVRHAGTGDVEIACAVAGALAQGVARADLIERLQSLEVRNRRVVVSTVPSGLTVMADIVDVNTKSAERTLELLRSTPCDGRRVVVTPGLVGLGPVQGAENFKLAALIELAGAELIAIARTNAEALLDGFGGRARRFDHRSDAVKWVRSHLKRDDLVLYLNDLPDHYP